jgi:DUF4097 and DUF4098 domain-containing protein YvlB
MADSLLMTRSRRVLLGTGVPLALAIIAVSSYTWVRGAVNQLVDFNEVSYPVSVTAPVTGGQARVISDNADLTLAAGQGNRIEVHGVAGGAMVRPIFSHKLTRAGLLLRSRCRVSIGTCSLNLDVTVPATRPANVTDSSGTIRARSLRGTVELSSNSGDIDASELTGDVGLTDSYGTISASDLSGRIRLSNISGDIDVTSLTGDSQLQDSFGNITVDGISASDVRCRDQSGDITIVFLTVPSHVAVSDSHGNIRLELPPGGTAYQVRTSNSSGSTRVSVPRDQSASNVITATDSSGDITIINR